MVIISVIGCTDYVHQFKVKQDGVIVLKINDTNVNPYSLGLIKPDTTVNMINVCDDLIVGDSHYGQCYKGWILRDDKRVYCYFTESMFEQLEYIGEIVKRSDDQYNFKGGRRTRNKRKSRKQRGRSGRRRRM
jgi:hypothetical protein